MAEEKQQKLIVKNFFSGINLKGHITKIALALRGILCEVYC